MTSETDKAVSNLDKATNALNGVVNTTKDATDTINKLAGALDNESKSADNAGKSWNRMGKYIFDLNYQRRRMIQQVNQGVGDWKLEEKAVNDAGDAVDKAGKKNVNTTRTLHDLSNVMILSTTSGVGLERGLIRLVEAFDYTQKGAGGFQAGLKALGGALLGPSGIILGVSAVLTGITTLTQKYGSLNNAIDALTGGLSDQQKAQEEVTNSIKGAENEYVKAVSNVNELKNEIDLAKQGFLKKDEVLKHYNETVGKTTGQVNSLNEAEAALQKNADAYIRFTLLKAAAQTALQEAAKKSFEAEKERQKSDEESVSYILSGLKNSKDTSILGIYAKNAARNREKAAAESDKDAKILEDIAKKFEEQAAQISKSFNFNFFGDNKISKDSKELYHAFSDLNTILTQTVFTFSKFSQFKSFGIDGLTDLNNDVITQTKKLDTGLSGFQYTAQQRLQGMIKPIQETAKELKIAFGGAIGDALEGIVSGFAEKGGGIGDAIKNFTGVIGGFLQNLGKQLIKTSGVLEGLQIAIGTGNPAAAAIAGLAAIAAGTALKAYATKIPAFATGGITNGPTLALVGDNPGGREAIVPSQDWREAFGGVGSNVNVTGEFVLKNDVLVAAVQRGQAGIKRYQ